MNGKRKINNIKGLAQLSLFGVSYAPLFLILIARIVYDNRDYLHWGGFNISSIKIFIEQFGCVTILLLFLAFSIIGTLILLQNVRKLHLNNSFEVTLKMVNNKSSETINYIATYIIPFVYDINNNFDLLILCFLLIIIFIVFINSSLIVVNPVLAVKYGIYEIEYEENNTLKSAIIISSNKYLIEGDKISLYPIGHKLYFCS